MQQQLDPKLVSKARGAVSNKTPQRIYQVWFSGLVQSLRVKVGKSKSKLELVRATSTSVYATAGSSRLS